MTESGELTEWKMIHGFTQMLTPFDEEQLRSLFVVTLGKMDNDQAAWGGCAIQGQEPLIEEIIPPPMFGEGTGGWAIGPACGVSTSG